MARSQSAQLRNAFGRGAANVAIASRARLADHSLQDEQGRERVVGAREVKEMSASSIIVVRFNDRAGLGTTAYLLRLPCLLDLRKRRDFTDNLVDLRCPDFARADGGS